MKTVYVVCRLDGRDVTVVCVCEDEDVADDLAARVGGMVEAVVLIPAKAGD